MSAQAMFPERRGQGLATDQQVKYVLKCFLIKFGMLLQAPVVTFEPWQQDQLSSHLIASRPDLKVRPLPAASSRID